MREALFPSSSTACFAYCAVQYAITMAGEKPRNEPTIWNGTLSYMTHGCSNSCIHLHYVQCSSATDKATISASHTYMYTHADWAQTLCHGWADVWWMSWCAVQWETCSFFLWQCDMSSVFLWVLLGHRPLLSWQTEPPPPVERHQCWSCKV